MAPAIRDAVVACVRYWSERAKLTVKQLLIWLGIPSSKYYNWSGRRGQPNQHNAQLPRATWLRSWERQAILDYEQEHSEEGYRRLTYMMLDANVVAVSPSSVYRVLKAADRLGQRSGRASSKGTGFVQATRPHEHWHMDVSYLNICGTFYYLCSILDGYSRYLVHWEIRECMTETDVETILQRGREDYPKARPRIISDNGSQFVARDFKSFVRACGMTHVRTSPYYPQSNGKIVIDRTILYQAWSPKCLPPMVARVFTTHSRLSVYQVLARRQICGTIPSDIKLTEGERNGTSTHELLKRHHSASANG